MASALSLMLAAIDSSCRILCTAEIAAQLRKTKMLPPSMVVVLSSEIPVDFGFIRITMVHASFSIPKAKTDS